jgi:hypothetical protein
MNRSDLQVLSKLRIDEAEVLLAAGRDAGAYYLAGYAVECALKACVARQVKAGDFPDRQFANAAFTHDLVALVRASGLETVLDRDRRANPTLDVNWAVVKDWKVETRYKTSVAATQAKDMLGACSGRNGILAWVKKRW